ncbi:hypothetical protein Poli38472_000219 [Pythium oligandrum]|uniref:ER membrane protein complex subunit 3 n=1 Tax=Pythium oligandrum TaxID=41045 RepID=A0A8K1CD93_PYTOL|nr:hypothetical protein Poli38472_000219 [Pythium oligandrum]|eukprot:TMW60177.1 hypothetical protein Poli38472_000219 [Pythium oligandrum]
MVEIILDPSIRDWVVLPMVLIIGCSASLRHYITLLLKTEKIAAIDELRPMNTVRRAAVTRMNSKFVSADAFAMRRHYFTASQKKHGMRGALREKVKNEAMHQMMNPNSMLEMMKGNMTFMVSNFVMMGLMSYFFGGFVIAKVPFSLTQKFKLMLQRGIDLTTLDVSYVSSISWYFLVMFGMSGFLQLILGEKTANDDTKAMQMQMGMGAGPNVGFDAPKMYKQERVSLRLHQHEWALEHAEKRLLGDPIPKKEPATSTASSTTSAAPSTAAIKNAKFNKTKKR